MTQVTIAASKAFIAFMLVGAVVVQAVILPVLAGQMAEIYPEVEYLRIPFTAAAALSAGVIVVLLVVVQAGPPGVIYPLFAGVAGCAALALVVLVMRGLLKKASQQESFLAEVI